MRGTDTTTSNWKLSHQYNRNAYFAAYKRHLFGQTRYDYEIITVLGCTLFSNIARHQAKDVHSRLLTLNRY